MQQISGYCRTRKIRRKSSEVVRPGPRLDTQRLWGRQLPQVPAAHLPREQAARDRTAGPRTQSQAGAKGSLGDKNWKTITTTTCSQRCWRVRHLLWTTRTSACRISSEPHIGPGKWTLLLLPLHRKGNRGQEPVPGHTGMDAALGFEPGTLAPEPTFWGLLPSP